MGYHTQAEVCPNVAYLGQFDGLLNISRFEYDSNISDEEFAKIEENGITELAHNWCQVDPCRTFGELYVEVWQKKENDEILEVNLINTSEYEAVGEEEWAVFSKNLQAVERFLKDFGLSEPIEKQNAVKQTT